MKQLTIAFLFSLLFAFRSTAQCPTAVIATVSSNPICKGDSTQVTTTLLGACSTYSVTGTPFAHVAGTGTLVTLSNDQVSGALPIGFSFRFFCLDYTQFYISSNGFITFSSSSSSGCCSGQSLPNISAPNNLIALAWEDYDPSVGGIIDYYTTGIAPNRKLIVNFTNVPHFGGGGGALSSQLVLNETTNVIEIFTTSQISDGGLHTMGIEDISGTIGNVAPGRNATSWSTSNDGKRFTPGQPPVGSFTYSWNPSVGLSDSSISTPMASPLQTTTYVVTVSDTSCAAVSDTLVISVDTTTLLVNILTPDTAICSGSVPISISSTGAASFIWSPAAGLNCTTCSNPIATPTTSTMYFVTVSTAMGVCTASDTFSIYVSNLNNHTLTASDSTMCGAGDTVQLNVAMSGVPSSGYCTPKYSSPCTSMDYVDNFSFNTIVNNATGCNGNANNYIFYSSMSTTVSPGNSYNLSMQAGISYPQGFGVWIDYNIDGDFNDAGEFVYSSPTAATTVFNSVITIPFNAVPGTTRLRVVCKYADTLSAGKACDSTFVFGECEDYNVLISGSQPNFTYSWSPSASLSNSTVANPRAFPSLTTTYTVTISDSVCSVTDTITIFVDTGIVSVSIVTPATSICEGDSVPINVSASGVGSYSWSPSTGLSCTTCANPVATPLYSTTYYVTAYSPYGACSKTDSISIGVSSLIQITPTASPNPACGAGDSVQLNVAISGVPPSGYCTPTYTSPCSSADYIDNFSFNTIVNNATGCNGNANNYIYYSSMSTTVIPGNSYALSMQSGTSWPQGFGVWIDYNQDGDFSDPGEFVYASPTSSTSPFNTTITIPMNAFPGTTRLRVACAYASTISTGQECYPSWSFGECEDYNVLISGPQSNFSYNWAPASNLSNPNIANPIALPSATTTYTVTVSDTLVGCSLSGVITVTVNPLPTVSVTPSAASICFGQNVTLAASGGNTYSWLPAGQSSSSIIVSISNNYSVIATDQSGCTAVGTSSVTVNPVPVVTVAGNTSICSGQNTTFTASGGSSYSWIPTGQTTSSIVVTPSSNTTYSVVATNASGCTGSTAVTVTIVPPPVASFTYSINGSIVTFTSTSQNATSWNWDFGDGGNSTSSSPFHSYFSYGTYTVTLITTNQCGSDTATAIITIVGIKEYADNFLLNVFPNPATNKIMINIQALNTSETKGILSMLNSIGEEVYRRDIPYINSSWKYPLEVDAYPAGIYLIKITFDDAVLTRRVIINK